MKEGGGVGKEIDGKVVEETMRILMVLAVR